MRIINLTQHKGTEAQAKAGLVEWMAEHLGHSDWILDLGGDSSDWETRAPTDLAEVLNVAPSDDIPPVLAARAEEVAGWVEEMACRAAMIGGHFGLTVALSEALTMRGILPVRAVTERKAAEQAQPDGSVRKVSRFEHIGFVPMLPSWWNDSDKVTPESVAGIRALISGSARKGVFTSAFAEYWKGLGD